MKKKIRRAGISKDGTTMVEVLVAFLVVMLMMAMFSKVVTTSVDLLKRSRENITKTESFNEEFYKSGVRSATSETEAVVLSIDNSKTSVYNKAMDVSLMLGGGLKTYTSNGVTRYYFDIIEFVHPGENEEGAEP